MPLMFVLLRSRLIPSLCSGSLLTGLAFPETLLLLFPTVLVLPIREVLLEFIRLAELPIRGFGVVRTVGFLVLIMLPIRELLLKLIRLAELPADGFRVLRTVAFLVLVIPPIRELLLKLIRLAELPTRGFGVVRTVAFLVLIILPIRDDCLPVRELTAVGFLLLRELVPRTDVLRRVVLLDGLRVPEAVPGRVVTGRLIVTLLG